jgi:hypothetical protein
MQFMNGVDRDAPSIMGSADEQGATDTVVATTTPTCCYKFGVCHGTFGHGFGALFEPTSNTVQKSPLAA